MRKTNVVNGGGNRYDIAGGVAKALRQDPGPGKAETEIPEFAGLVKAARERRIGWETRLELYRGLGLSKLQKIRVETQVVEHFSRGVIDPQWIAKIVRLNLFYICSNAKREPIFEDDLERACRKAASKRDAARILGLGCRTAHAMLRGFKMESGNGKAEKVETTDITADGESILPTEALLRRTLEGINLARISSCVD